MVVIDEPHDYQVKQDSIDVIRAPKKNGTNKISDGNGRLKPNNNDIQNKKNGTNGKKAFKRPTSAVRKVDPIRKQPKTEERKEKLAMPKTEEKKEK